MAREGLRTLVFATKRLTPQAYQSWLLVYNDARAAIHDREDRVKEALEAIESDLEVNSANGILPFKMTHFYDIRY